MRNGQSNLPGCVRLFSHGTVLFIVLSVCLSGCSTTLIPTATRGSAKSLDQGELQVDLGFVDYPSASISYGITPQTDFGLDLQQTSTLWIQHTMVSNESGFSAAVNAGIFHGAFDEGEPLPAEDRTTTDTLTVDGGYVGGMLEYETTDNLTLSLGYRYHQVNYDSFSLDYSASGFLFFGNFLYFDNYIDEWTVSSRDLRGVGLLSLQTSFLLKSHLRVHLGVNCQLNHTENNTRLPGTECSPLVGLSFNQR